MYEDDLVAALQQSVKQEIIENYLRERRIVEEEIALLCETVSSFHGGLAAWERRRERLARALVLPGAAARFFALAGLGEPPQMPAAAAPALCLLPRGWTRPQRYQRLVRHLYRSLWRTGMELAAEREKVLRLRQEINEDILAFERNHDMLTLTTVLRSMDPAEVQRRHILGVNFSAAETAVSAANLSFHPVGLERLGLHPDLGRELARPRPPAEVLREAEPILRGLCRANPCEVDALWHAGVKAAAPSGLKPLEEL